VKLSSIVGLALVGVALLLAANAKGHPALPEAPGYVREVARSA
jgi:hypothetical protein